MRAPWARWSIAHLHVFDNLVEHFLGVLGLVERFVHIGFD
jgi:hypothetical protein